MSKTVDILDPASYPHKYIQLSKRKNRKYHYIDLSPPGQASSNGETVVCCHGFPDLWYGYRFQMFALANRGYRVIVPSMLGYGETDKPQELELYSYGNVCKDLVALMEQIGVTGKFHVIGHDWYGSITLGGMVAWRLCNYFPALVKSLIVFCTPYAPPSQPSQPYIPSDILIKNYVPHFGYQLWFATNESVDILNKHPDLFLTSSHSRTLQNAFSQQRIKGLTSAQREKNEAYVKEGWLRERMLKMVAKRESGALPLLDNREDEELKVYIDTYTKGGFRGPLNWYKTRKVNYDEEIQSKVSKYFPETIPTLFVCATEDAALPPSLSATMKKFFLKPDNLNFVVMKGADHWILVDENYRDQANDLILKHLDENSTRAVARL